MITDKDGKRQIHTDGDLTHLKKEYLLKIIKRQSEEIDRLRSGETGPGIMENDPVPSQQEAEASYEKARYRNRFIRSVMSTAGILLVVAAATVLVAVLLLPVLRIYGQSMNGTLKSGELVISVKGASFDTGDIIAFYYNNNILVKRVIAVSGDWVDIDLNGNVFVNQKEIDEPYIEEKAFGEPTVDFPYQVPDERVFVLGDNRSVSVDSRHKSVGCVTQEQIVGKIVFRIWPLSRIGPVH